MRLLFNSRANGKGLASLKLQLAPTVLRFPRGLPRVRSGAWPRESIRATALELKGVIPVVAYSCLSFKKAIKYSNSTDTSRGDDTVKEAL